MTTKEFNQYFNVDGIDYDTIRFAKKSQEIEDNPILVKIGKELLDINLQRKQKMLEIQRELVKINFPTRE